MPLICEISAKIGCFLHRPTSSKTVITAKFDKSKGYTWSGSTWSKTTKRWHSSSSLSKFEIDKLRHDMECIRDVLQRDGNRVSYMRFDGGWVDVEGWDRKGKRKGWTFERCTRKVMKAVRCECKCGC